MNNKKQFTLIELIIVIVVIGILAAMALPKFSGVIRNAKLAAMINDKEVLEKTLVIYNQKNNSLPLLNDDEELIIANEGISLTKLVLAEEIVSEDMKTIYTSLQETLKTYNDSEERLYRININDLKNSLSKNIKYGHKKSDKDFYVYSAKTGNVYYYNYLVNGEGTIQHDEFDTLLKETELVNRKTSPVLDKDSPIIGDETTTDEEITLGINTISLGAEHSVKIEDDGSLSVWGNNQFGQLGIGNTTDQLTPQKISLPNGEKAISVKLGNAHSFALSNAGNLYAWGYNSNGELGLGNTEHQLTPQKVTIPNGEKPISIASGDYHMLVVTNSGNLYSCGWNGYNQLGLGNKTNYSTLQKVTIPNGEKAVSVISGGRYSAIQTNNENYYVWGWNNYGQLGLGNTTDQSTLKLLTIKNGEKIKKLFLGYSHSMAITDNGNIYSWGDNFYGQLGIGSTTNQLNPQLVTVPNGEKVLDISLGLFHSAILTNKGKIYVCGNGSSGQIGNGEKSKQLTLQQVKTPSNEKFTTISSGNSNLMSITNKGNVYSWGYNSNGQVGNGTTENQFTPVKITLP